MVVQNRSLDWYIERLHENKPFSMGLYGDGELLALLKSCLGSETAEGEVYTDELGDEIGASFREDENFVCGSAPSLIEPLGKQIDRFLDGKQITFYNGEIWDYAVREGQLGSFIKELRNKNVVLVGNSHLRALTFLNYAHFIEIPMRHAYSEIDRIEQECLAYDKPSVFIFCAGLTAIPLISRLYDKKKDCFLLDLGSIFDVFVGIGAQRGWRAAAYANPEKLKEIIDGNLCGLA